MSKNLSEREMLLELRKAIAKKSGQATYLVYNDVELEMLLKERPKTLEELTALKGFPKTGKRVAAYGNALVRIFNLQPSTPTVGIAGVGKSSVF